MAKPWEKNQKQTGIDSELAEIMKGVTEKVQRIVSSHIDEGNKVLKNRVQQLHEQLVSIKATVSIERARLTTERGTALAELNQAKQRLRTIEKERDALVKKVRGRA